MKQQQQLENRVEQPGNLSDSDNGRLINLKYYTDPLCCWSWAFEKNWSRLREDRGQYFTHEYVLGGMLKTWKQFSDPINAVSNPIQMGPVWMHVSQVTHTPMDYTVWHQDPPSSSYPACIAIKCASLQSARAEDLYLNKVREAVMTRCLNIAKQDVLLSLAKELHKQEPTLFCYQTFERDLTGGKGKENFVADIKQAAFHAIGRFPTLTITDRSGIGIILTGYRPYDQLLKTFDQFLETTLDKSIRLNNSVAI